ncbi:hypothetical protein SHO565_62580 [Streptomyces sp. HO565]
MPILAPDPGERDRIGRQQSATPDSDPQRPGDLRPDPARPGGGIGRKVLVVGPESPAGDPAPNGGAYTRSAAIRTYWKEPSR